MRAPDRGLAVPRGRRRLGALAVGLGLGLAGPLVLPLASPESAESAAFAQPPKTKATKPATKPVLKPELLPSSAKKAPKKDTKDTKTPAKGDKPGDAAPQGEGGPTGELRGPTRIDFDDRLVQGQTNKSGAVYLFDRKETGISSMVHRRKSFRQLTLGTIYDR